MLLRTSLIPNPADRLASGRHEFGMPFIHENGFRIATWDVVYWRIPASTPSMAAVTERLLKPKYAGSTRLSTTWRRRKDAGQAPWLVQSTEGNCDSWNSLLNRSAPQPEVKICLMRKEGAGALAPFDRQLKK
jgi:hypothetical protein